MSLKKPGAKLAVRPTPVGETLQRLVGKTIMASPAVQDAVTNMLPLQQGVAVEGACETTTIVMQHWVNEHSIDQDWAILQVDLTNAFNLIDRRSMADEEPTGLSQPTASGTFYCPFPTCPHSQGQEKGWRTKVSVVTHVSNYHVAAGAVPCKSWLKPMSLWVCGHCLTLHSSKRSRSNEDCFVVSPGELSTIPSVSSALIPRTPQRQRIPPQRVLFPSPDRPQSAHRCRHTGSMPRRSTTYWVKTWPY